MRIVISPARPEQTVDVTRDEVERAVQAITASGMSIYLSPCGDQVGKPPTMDDICCGDGVVEQVFSKRWKTVGQ